jgi:hypothetical protein
MKLNYFYQSHFLILGAILSGCSTHSIVKDSGCKLTNAQMTHVENLYRGDPKLGIKKIDQETLKFWILISPKDPKLSPLEKPELILKLHKNNKMTQEIRISEGQRHLCTNELFKEYLERSGNKSALLAEEQKNNKSFSSLDIWPHAKKYVSMHDLNQMAVSFDVSMDQFRKILDSDYVSVMIQTLSDPIVAALEKEQLLPLLEFKTTCLEK